MKNKVLVKVIVPEVHEEYDVFIPVNEIIWKVVKLLTKSISDLSGGNLNYQQNYALLNMNTGIIYSNNTIVYDTDIRNASELVLFSIKNDKM